MHHTHKEPAWGWVAVLEEWRRSRTRRIVRAQAGSPAATRR
ncbi:hypothetical protein [Brevundimonas sp.]|nr:hypothetical protein [Brevundimonas sp.]